MRTFGYRVIPLPISGSVTSDRLEPLVGAVGRVDILSIDHGNDPPFSLIVGTVNLQHGAERQSASVLRAVDSGRVERRFRAGSDLKFVQVAGVDIHAKHLVLACKPGRLKADRDRESRDRGENPVNSHRYSFPLVADERGQFLALLRGKANRDKNGSSKRKIIYRSFLDDFTSILGIRTDDDARQIIREINGDWRSCIAIACESGDTVHR